MYFWIPIKKAWKPTFRNDPKLGVFIQLELAPLWRNEPQGQTTEVAQKLGVKATFYQKKFSGVFLELEISFHFLINPH